MSHNRSGDLLPDYFLNLSLGSGVALFLKDRL